MIPGGFDDDYPVDVEFAYEDVKDAIKNIEYNGPEIHRVLWAFLFTPLPRTHLADLCRCDSSTAKRKLDKAVDSIMQYLNNRDIMDEILVRIPQAAPESDDAEAGPAVFQMQPAPKLFQSYDYEAHKTVDRQLPRCFEK